MNGGRTVMVGPAGAEQFAEKVGIRRPAPKGASDSQGLAVSL